MGRSVVLLFCWTRARPVIRGAADAPGFSVCVATRSGNRSGAGCGCQVRWQRSSVAAVKGQLIGWLDKLVGAAARKDEVGAYAA